MNLPAPFRRGHDFPGRAALSPARRAAIANQRRIIARVARRGEDTVALLWSAPAERSGDGALEWAKTFACSTERAQAKAASRRTCRRSPKSAWSVRAVVALVWMLAVQLAGAATVVSGNVSGTWTTNGSPYILSADCTVVSNQVLNIQPGVEVLLGSNVTLTINGAIEAIGTAEQPIRMRAANPTNRWFTIELFCNGFTNRFLHCEISESYSSALVFGVFGGNRNAVAEVINCDFSNCGGNAIVGNVLSFPTNQAGGGSATFTPEIHNCRFESTGGGCAFLVQYMGTNTTDAYANPRITDNVFSRLGTALYLLEAHSVVGGTNISRPVFANNTVDFLSVGVDADYTYFQPKVRNNIFTRGQIAVKNRLQVQNVFDVSYNCFFTNGVDFFGYPNSYGLPVQNNHNGSPCDAFFNIFLNPQFLDTNQFLLSNFSPCIDAGDPAIADVCFQFSHGSAISDIGAYGGPDACGWLSHGFAPVITGPPAHQSSCVGSSAAFQVSVQGSAPLSYRWYFNTNTLLGGETNAQLNLANLQTNQAGLYSVAVSNSFGSVTSAPARLLVFDACVGINLYAGLSITGIVGRTYVVDATTNFASPNWIPFATNTFTQPRWLLLDTNTPFNAGRFFRVRLLP